MADTKIDDDVRDVLVRSSCNANQLYLPAGQLDRGLYERVNKALANAGGKWNRSAKAHIFSSDAGTKLTAMLSSGVSVDEKKRDQAFFTPRDLAERIVEIAEVRGQRVLEPSAGKGSLASACRDAGADCVDCCETNPEYVEHLARNEIANAIYTADFLTMPAIDHYGRVVMNPPFTKNQDIKHVNHALKFLAPKGILVAIMFDNQTRKGFQEIVAKYDPEIIPVERGAFKESGTNIATIIVKIAQG